MIFIRLTIALLLTLSGMMPTVYASSEQSTWDKDVAFLRNPVATKKHPTDNLIIKVHALRHTRPLLVKMIPNSIQCAQKISEQNTVMPLLPADQKKMLSLFAKYPPITMQGWAMYACLWKKQCPKQSASILLNAFKTFWITSTMSLDNQDIFCTELLRSSPKKSSLCSANHPWLASHKVHMDRMIALLCDTSVTNAQSINKARALGQWAGLKPTHPLMLCARLLTRNASEKDPDAIRIVHSLPIDVRQKPLLSLAQVRYHIRCNNVTQAVHAWTKSTEYKNATFQMPYLNKQIKQATYTTGLALMHNLWTSGQNQIHTENRRNGHNLCMQAMRLPCPQFFAQSVDVALLKGMILYSTLNRPLAALRQFDHAIHLIEQGKAYEKGPLYRSKAKALFWAGLCCERLKRPTMAQAFWKKSARFGFYFYGQMAQFKLNRPITMAFSKADIQKGLVLPAQRQLVRLVHTLGQQDPEHGYAIAPALIKDLKDSGTTPHDKKKALYLVDRIDAAQTPHTAKMMANHPNCVFTQAYPTMTAPIPYDDPDLVQAIILAESAFNPTVTSSAGAKGLMQVMPDEVREACTALGIKHTPTIAFDPQVNIRLGIHVLRQKKAKMLSTIATLASYNAGENRVAQWIQRYPLNPTPVQTWTWMESIPFQETRQYVAQNLANYATYRWMQNRPLTPKNVRSLLAMPKPLCPNSRLARPQTYTTMTNKKKIC